jgi:transposase, IS30 family
MAVRVARGVVVRFWGLVRSGVAPRPAAGLVGVSHETGRRWFREAGGVYANAPRQLGERYLSVSEREEISRGLVAGTSLRADRGRVGAAGLDGESGSGP